MFQLDGLGRKSVMSLLMIVMLALIQIQLLGNTFSDFQFVNKDSDRLNAITSESELQWSFLYSGILRGGYTRTTDMTIDSEGNTYFTGVAESSLFPTINAYDSSFNGEYDCFVMKFNRYGTLVYSTFIGGSDSDKGAAIEVDEFGNIYVAGNTFSTDFPVINANQSENSGNWDCFVLKLDSTGSSMIFSTYIGGNSTDEVTDIALDSEGNILVTGVGSPGFPIVKAIDETNTVGCFVLQLDPSGSSIKYSTIVGMAHPDSIATDSQDCVYVSGFTSSTSFPTVNPLFEGHTGYVKNDCFLLKINSAGTAIDFSTYIGGTNQEQFAAVDLDTEDNIYVVGYTYSDDFPVTTGSYDDSHNGETDIFVMKINSSLDLVYSTFMGGESHDVPYAIDVDISGNVFIASSTMSEDCPLVNELQSFKGGATDVYVCILTTNGTELEFASPVGGSHYDYPSGISVDESGNITITGRTQSLDFPFDHYFGNYPLLEESSFFTKIGKDYTQTTSTSTKTETTPSSTPTNTTTLPFDFGLLSIISFTGTATIVIAAIAIARFRATN